MTARLQSLSLCMVLGLLSGCAMGTPARKVSDSAAAPQTVSMRPSDRMFYWREEARELEEMAERREREADLLSRSEQGSATHEVAVRMRSLVKQLRAAAEYADEQAQEAQRQMPHGMMQ